MSSAGLGSGSAAGSGNTSGATSGNSQEYPAWTKAAGWLMLPFAGEAGSFQF